MARDNPPVQGNKNRDGLYGPHAGGLQVIPISLAGGLGTKSYEHRISVPTGMKYEIVAAEAIALGLTGTPTVQVGDSTASSAFVAALALTTGSQSLTLKKNAVTSEVAVIITDASGEAFDSISVNLVVYVTSPPDSLAIRNILHY